MEKRRSFIIKSALGAGGLALGLSAKSYGRIVGSNDRVNLAFMGLGRRVGGYYDALQADFNTELVYLCDVKKSQIDRVMGDLEGRLDYKPRETDDIRKVLDDSDVDAIMIAAPDHWHAPASWMAMEAGKHVYVEKPCSHNPREGELLVHFQKKYNKVVQMGNQQRSGHRSS
jgi:predicted dehydrogenase